MREFLRRLLRHRLGIAGAVISLSVVGLGLSAPLVAAHNPLEMHVLQSLRPPSAQHWLGTDQYGRDVWARVVYGASLSITVGFLSMALATGIGLPIGAAAGFFAGRIDAVLMRIMDAILAFPAILLAVGLVAGLGPSKWSGVLAIGVVYIPVMARVTRGAVVTQRERQYVEAARAYGLTEWRILGRQVLPNSIAPILVQYTVGFATAIVIEASLSFLGAGTPPPTPSWGSMLNEARPFMVTAPHVAIFPGVAISLAVLGVNLLGDGIRDVLDPRVRL